jgi:hypothetical protein
VCSISFTLVADAVSQVSTDRLSDDLGECLGRISLSNSEPIQVLIERRNEGVAVALVRLDLEEANRADSTLFTDTESVPIWLNKGEYVYRMGMLPEMSVAVLVIWKKTGPGVSYSRLLIVDGKHGQSEDPKKSFARRIGYERLGAAFVANKLLASRVKRWGIEEIVGLVSTPSGIIATVRTYRIDEDGTVLRILERWNLATQSPVKSDP